MWAGNVDKGGSERVMEELSQGRHYADQLRDILLLRDDTYIYDSAATSLVEKILHSFTHSLSILQLPLMKSDSDSQTVPIHKDRRGCYKRRKTSEILIKETTSLVEDGHAWRKYGQKVILHAKNPRNYYRCTHKFDQGCQATKQVEKIEDDPFPLFKTTYLGHHTCSIFNVSPHQIIMDINSTTHHHPEDSNSIIFSFDSVPIKQETNASVSEASSVHLRCIDNNLISAISSSDIAMYSCANAITTHDHGTNNMTFEDILALYE